MHRNPARPSPPSDADRPLRTTTTGLLVSLILLPALAGAAERNLGAPVLDGVAETTYRQVNWDDFKGGGQAPPGWNSRWNSGSFAHILCGVHLGAWDMEHRQESEDAWVAVPVGIRPYAVMDKFHSAVRPGSRTADALAHEQIHFDISEMTARRMAVTMSGLEGRGGSAQKAREDLDAQIRRTFAEGQKELRELQQRYDKETNHRQNRKQQRKWAAKIEKMFREATDDLVAVLEERGSEE